MTQPFKIWVPPSLFAYAKADPERFLRESRGYRFEDLAETQPIPTEPNAPPLFVRTKFEPKRVYGRAR